MAMPMRKIWGDGIYCTNKMVWQEPKWNNPELVSVIVTCSGNYGKYLEKCFKSIYEQTYPNFEVILADDNTNNLPNLHSYNLSYYKVNFRQANKTRNYAFKQTKGKYVIYVDADDYLYGKCVISGLMCAMKEGTSIVTGKFKMFDQFGNEITCFTFPQTFDKERLFHYNYIQTTSLIRKKDFVGFDETLEQFQDWDFYVRTLLANKKIVYFPEFILCHVRHGENMQSKYVTEWKGKNINHYLTTEDYKDTYRDIVYKNMVLTIATSFSGKAWCFNKYFQRLSDLNFPKDRTRLVFFDDSNNETFTKMLKNKVKKIRSKYKYTTTLSGGVRPIGYEPYPVPEHMAQIYNRMRFEMIQGTHCFTWEDDQIPPKDTVERLTRHLWTDIGIVSGYAKSRQYKKPLVWYFQDSLTQAFPNGKQVEQVDAVGLGCALIPVLVLRNVAFRAIGNAWEAGHDIVFCRDASRQQFKILVDWTVTCSHLDKKGTITPKIKLNLGCGYHHKNDYINIDKMKLYTVDEVLDLSQPLPYPDESVDLIETHHLIEHIPTHLGTLGYLKDFVPLLKDWHRVLNGNGKIIIECPDFDGLITLYNKKPKKRDELIKHFFGYGGENQYHYMGWNFDRLRNVLKEAGFNKIRKKKAKDYHAKESPCLRVEAVK